jgi:tetratricopeptide (TPR) repeat protein
MNFRILTALAFCLIVRLMPAQVLEGIAGNAQLQREADQHFLDGLKALMLEKPEDASKSFEKSLDINDKNAAAHFKLAEIQADRNQIGDALSHAQSAARLDPKNRYYLELLADMQELSGDWKSCIKTWRKIGELPEQDKMEIRLAMARVYIEQKRFREAIDELNLCEKETGPSPDLFQFRMNLYLKKNDLKGAISEGDAWLKAFPEDPEGWNAVCRVLISNNKITEAKSRIREMINRFPDNPATHLMLADVYLQEKNEAAAFEEMQLAFRNPDLPAEAKVEIVSGYLRAPQDREEQSRAMELCDILVKVHPENARALIVRGDVLNLNGKQREAREMYLKAKLIDRNNFALWEQLVLLDLQLNETDSLVIHTTTARQLFPNTASFAFYNGTGLLFQKKYEPAVEALEQAARVSLENRMMQVEIYSMLGDAFYNLKQLDKSFASYEEVLAMDSSNAHVLNNYSYFLSLEKTRLEKAITMSSRLVSLFPEDATYLDTYGWVLYQAGQFKEALIPLEKACKASGSGVIWEHYGDALFRNGKEAEAEAAWKKASELGGGTSLDLPAKIRDRKVY